MTQTLEKPTKPEIAKDAPTLALEYTGSIQFDGSIAVILDLEKDQDVPGGINGGASSVRAQFFQVKTDEDRQVLNFGQERVQPIYTDILLKPGTNLGINKALWQMLEAQENDRKKAQKKYISTFLRLVEFGAIKAEYPTANEAEGDSLTGYETSVAMRLIQKAYVFEDLEQWRSVEPRKEIISAINTRIKYLESNRML